MITVDKLNRIVFTLRNIRDDQTEIECSEDDCICDAFDSIIEDIEELIERFKRSTK